MNKKPTGPLHSMTGFASAKGEQETHSWSWELRSLNAKGLDLRLRIPDWLDGLESALRAELSKALNRGSVNLTLRINRKEDSGSALQINEPVLEAMLEAVKQVEAKAATSGLDLVPTRASDLLTLRGVLDAQSTDDDNTALVAQLKSDFPALLSSFLSMRETEGKALKAILLSQLDSVAALCADAREVTVARAEQTAETLRANLTRIMDNSDGLDQDRVVQELALVAVKSDVTEELDRLDAHVEAARGLIAQGTAMGRKLDFLMQEFNREANTLCSKAQNRALTAVGLELKALIDQMREQVQNVE